MYSKTVRTKRWTEIQLRKAAKISTSIRQVLHHLRLKEAGGNYAQIKKYLYFYKVQTAHFTGKVWNKGKRGIGKPRLSLNQILTEGSHFQSYKLKKRLFAEKIKFPRCEECGWEKVSADGRIPLELDHINGNSRDNRLKNLRILCPNCHSLKPTHRGRNKKHGSVAEWYTRST